MPRLNRQQIIQQASQRITSTTSLPAPITGWNTRDALTQMAPTDAITIDNWYPDYGGCVIRNGFTSFATGLPNNPVQTLAEFWNATTHKFLAACGTGIYNITAGGTIGSPIASGFSSSAWQTSSFSGHQFWTNGVDSAQIYDGTSFSAATLSGVTTSTLVGSIPYQGFMIFWAVNSPIFYYLAAGAISGTLHAFDLSTISQLGGNIAAVTTFSHDGGNGVLDFVAFIMTSGECIVYFGTDPSQVSLWSLTARYRLAPIVNIRSVCRYGAESYMTSYDDHVPLQQQLVALKVGTAPPRSKASGAVAQAVAENFSAFGWQALYYPKGRRLIFNIPIGGGQFQQHVYNTATDAWCRFINMNAYTWGVFNNALYFGDASGNVWLADNGNLDNMGPVQADCQQAWNVFSVDNRKRVSAIRPILQSTGGAGYNFGVGFDYQDVNVGPATSISNQGSPWDVSPWDTSPWSPELIVNTTWGTQQGTGQAVSFRITASVLLPLTWMRTDLRIEVGQKL